MIFKLFLLLNCWHILSVAEAQFQNCDYFQNVQPNRMYYIYSPRFGEGNYRPNTNCRWSAQAPERYTLLLNCSTVFLPTSSQCTGDRIEVSKTGNKNLTDAYRYCGIGRFSVESVRNEMVVALRTTNITPGGNFLCTIQAKLPPICQCGARKKSKIVGGMPAGPNEFPMMAGLVEAPTAEVFCGATVIAQKYALSAAHCVQNKDAVRLALLVGDKDYTAGNDSMYTALYRIASYVIYPTYNAEANAHDVSILNTDVNIIYNEGVGPVCLPFRYAAENQTFVGKVVEATGWGTTEYGGPASTVLQKVNVNVTSNEICSLFYPNPIDSDQLCTFARGKDTCQLDSGGPLFYTNPQNNLLYLVGIISYGIGCATSSPSVNSRVTAYLDWVQHVTPGVTYCIP